MLLRILVRRAWFFSALLAGWCASTTASGIELDDLFTDRAAARKPIPAKAFPQAYPRGPHIVGDANGDGRVDDTDLLIVLKNIGQNKKGWPDGDFNSDGRVDGEDFTAVSDATGSRKFTSPAELRSIVGPATRRNGTAATYHFPPESLRNLPMLTLRGISNTQLRFYGPISGRRRYADANLAKGEFYGDENGVVNLIDCHGLTLFDLSVTNTHVYEGPQSMADLADDTPAETIPEQSSCALNIGNSRGIRLVDCRLHGQGKSVLVVHSNSQVELSSSAGRKSQISGAYFPLNVAASRIEAADIVLQQELYVQGVTTGGRRTADSHAAIAISTTPVRWQDGRRKRYVNPTHVRLTRALFRLKTGRSLVTGSGNYKLAESVPAKIELIEPELHFRGPPEHGAYGLVGYAATWDSIRLSVSGGVVHAHDESRNHAPVVAPIASRLVDFVSTRQLAPARFPRQGLGRFVHYGRLVNGQLPTPPGPRGNLVSAGLDAHDVK